MWQRHSSNLYLVSWHAIGKASMFPQCVCDVFKQAHCAPECVEELIVRDVLERQKGRQCYELPTIV